MAAYFIPIIAVGIIYIIHLLVELKTAKYEAKHYKELLVKEKKMVAFLHSELTGDSK